MNPLVEEGLRQFLILYFSFHSDSLLAICKSLSLLEATHEIELDLWAQINCFLTKLLSPGF